MSAEAQPLPTADTLQSATFIQSVDHARTILLAPLSEHTASLMSAMLRTSNGARGFFVTLLSDPAVTAVDEDVDERVVGVVKDAATGNFVPDLLVKNVVMPATMVVAYEREGNEMGAQRSQMTLKRAVKVSSAVMEKGGVVEAKLRNMYRAMDDPNDESSEYAAFVRKWAYDQAQRSAAKSAIELVH